MSALATIIHRRPARLALVSVLGLGVLFGGAAAANAAMGQVRTQESPLTVRSGPGTGYAAVGTVAKGASLTISCRTKGTRVSGPYGATSVWNKIGDGRYVSDAYTTSTEKAPTCTPTQLKTVQLVGFKGAQACSSDERAYANGRVPASARCALYGDKGESLRPRAAAAFNALSMAYEREHGRSLCVTDSYRSLEEQVAVKAKRGKWAAKPGTSEHGLGKAVDLCGGVGTFGSDAYRWMKANGPKFGWVHPAWAEPGGRLPEPWHWEYRG
jgi:uncharacterized protein YraI